MKTRLTYILAASLFGISALSVDAFSSKNTNTEAGLQSETYTEIMTDSLINTEPVYHHFETPAEAIAFMQESENSENYARGILPQMAMDELSYAEKLLNNEYDGFIVIDKSRMKLIKFNKYGEEEHIFGMACAKNYGTKHKNGDSRTPEGFFSVKQIQNSTDWKYVDDEGNVSSKTGEFGPRFFRLQIPGITCIGIHGTAAPWSIGGRRSHGCIRLTNENIMKVVEMVEPGMPVIITPGKKDMAVNKAEGYDIPKINTIPANMAMNE